MVGGTYFSQVTVKTRRISLCSGILLSTKSFRNFPMKKLAFALVALAAVATASAADQFRTSAFAGASYSSASASKTFKYTQGDDGKTAQNVDEKAVNALNNSLDEGGLGFNVGADAHYFLTYTNGVKLGLGGVLSYNHFGESDKAAEEVSSYGDKTDLTYDKSNGHAQTLKAFKVKTNVETSANYLFAGFSALAQFQPVEGFVPFAQLAVGPVFGSLTQKFTQSTVGTDATAVDSNNSNAAKPNGDQLAAQNQAHTYNVDKLGYGLYGAVGADYQQFSAKVFVQYANLRAPDEKVLKATKDGDKVDSYVLGKKGDSLTDTTSGASNFQVGLQLGVNF